MAGYSFSRNMHLTLHGREYVIEDRLPDGDFRLRDIAFDECKPVSEAELINAWIDDELEFLGDRSVTLAQRKLTKSFVDDLNMLDKTDLRKVEAKRRLAYLKALDELKLSFFTKEAVQPVIDKVHEEIKDAKKKPHWKTVCYRWHPLWKITQGDIRSVVPHYEKRGNTEPKFCHERKYEGDKFTMEEKRWAKEVKGIVDEVIKKVYMNRQRLPIDEVCETLDIRIAEENKLRAPDDQLPDPDDGSVYAIIRKIDPYEKVKAREGKHEADKRYRSNKQGATFKRPLERIEIDDTTLDLFVVDPETRLPVGRPTLTFAMDCYSRMPVGFHIGFDGAGYLAVMQCLLHAISPKTYLKELFPKVQNDWPVHGIAGEAIVDNGPAYISEDFKDACKQIGTTVIYCPKSDPDAKPRVERFYGIQNQKMLHRLPGTSFSNIIARRDYDPMKNAIISFDALMSITHVFLVDIYARDEHRGLNGIPAVAWEKGVEQYPPPWPRRRKDLRILLGHMIERDVGPSGIEFENLHYNCPELAPLRRRDLEKVKVKYNPTDMSMVYVYNPYNDRYIPTPALDQQYTKGLSLWQHKVIKRYVRRKMKEHINTNSLRSAKKIIQAIVDQEWLKSNGSAARKLMARYYGVRQPDYNAVMEMEAGQPPEQIGSGEDIPMLNPAPSPLEGMSDIGRPLLTEGQASEFKQSDSGAVMTVLEAKKVESRSNGKSPNKRKRKTNGNAAQKGSDADKGDPKDSDMTEGDDDLDMTNFDSSYDLPTKEA